MDPRPAQLSSGSLVPFPPGDHKATCDVLENKSRSDDGASSSTSVAASLVSRWGAIADAGGAVESWPSISIFRSPSQIAFAEGPVPGTLLPDEQYQYRGGLMGRVHEEMGHRSAPAMLWALRSVARLSWDGMRKECFEVAKSCEVCSKRHIGQDAFAPAGCLDPVAPMFRVYVDVACRRGQSFRSIESLSDEVVIGRLRCKMRTCGDLSTPHLYCISPPPVPTSRHMCEPED